MRSAVLMFRDDSTARKTSVARPDKVKQYIFRKCFEMRGDSQSFFPTVCAQNVLFKFDVRSLVRLLEVVMLYCFDQYKKRLLEYFGRFVGVFVS